jgi:hypothetical protein
MILVLVVVAMVKMAETLAVVGVLVKVKVAVAVAVAVAVGRSRGLAWLSLRGTCGLDDEKMAGEAAGKIGKESVGEIEEAIEEWME